MTGFWTFFLRKRSFTVLLLIVLSAAGVYAIIAIPKESAPEVQIPVGIITTVLPGASAEDVERLITDKIEDRVLGVERVSKVTSSSGGGVSSITVEFEAKANIDKSIQLLKDEVEKVRTELPDEAEDPVVTDVNFADQPVLIASISGDYTPSELTALGKTIQGDLERVPGVSSVALSGVRDREVTVVLSQAKLRQYGLSAGDVIGAISASGAASPLGSITSDGVIYTLRLEAGLTDPSQVAELRIPGPGNASLRIADVGKVEDGLAPASSFSRVSVAGEPSAPALTLSVFKSRGGNITKTTAGVRTRLDELTKSTLSGGQVVVSFDAGHEAQKDLFELTRTGIETVILVVLMLIATLGWREAIAAAISVPLSFLIAFIGIWASGNTLNFVSLFALILAIGILVDSGVVVVEAIHTRLIKYGTKQAAAAAAIREYALPLTAGTLTTIAVFVPLFFLSGVVGKFIASIPFTVIFVLFASIFVALAFIPIIALWLVKPTLSPFQEKQEEWNERAKEWYQRYLRSILGNRKYENRFIAIMVGLFVLALFLPGVGAVQSIFFPGEDTNLIYVELEKPQGTALSETDLSTREAEEILYNDKRISSFVTEVGAASSFGGSPGSASKLANITINLDENRKQTSTEVVADLRKSLAPITSAHVTVAEPAGGPPTGSAVSITFSGDNLEALASAVALGERALSEVSGAVNISTSARDDGTEFIVNVDPAKAAERGVSPLGVAQTLRTALYGTKATNLQVDGDDIKVNIRMDLNPTYVDPDETTHTSIDTVRELLIPGSKGPVPLSQVATIEYAAAKSVIRHEDGKRIATLSSDVTGGATALEATADFKNRMDAVALPDGVTMTIGGESEDVNQSFAEMGLALLAGAALMLGILVLEFNSFRHSFHLLSIIPLSLIGVLVGLMLTGAPLSFPSMLGVIALAGVIINHAIILMDSIARIREEHPERSVTDVVIDAAGSRFRPIMLTTIVTVVGMIPLSFASALWGPLAFSIMFGLAWSVVLTLVLIPVLYHRSPDNHRAE